MLGQRFDIGRRDAIGLGPYFIGGEADGKQSAVPIDDRAAFGFEREHLPMPLFALRYMKGMFDDLDPPGSRGERDECEGDERHDEG